MTAEDPDLANNEGLWGLLLGKKFDRIPKKDRSLNNLVDAFYQGRKSIIDSHYGSKRGFLDHLEATPADETARDLRWIWAEKNWSLQSRGQKYDVQSDIEEEVARAGDATDAIIHQYNNGLTLIWPEKPVRKTEIEGDEVESRVRTEAKPVYVRRIEDSRMEIRGAKSRVRKFVTSFTDSPDVESIELDPVDTSVVEGLSSVFSTEIETLRLVEAEFEQSYLPDNSAITIRNEDGVQHDLNAEDLYPGVIDDYSLTDLSQLKFVHTKSDKTFVLKAHEDDEGIYFDVQDNNIPETDKENIEEILAERFGIFLNSVYRYDAQLHDDYITNQILGRNYAYYEKYYDELPAERQEFLERFIEIVETKFYECYQCYTKHADQVDECDCGNDTFREREEFAIDIAEKQIQNVVEERLEEFDETIDAGDFTLRRFSVEREDRTNTYLKTSFILSQLGGMVSGDYYSNYRVFCAGNRSRLPRRIGAYLLDTVLVTYGQSHFRDRPNFGSIDLYEFLTTDDPEQLFANAVDTSYTRLPERIRERVKEAEDNIQWLNQKTQSLQDEPDDVDWEYTAKRFEKDVFYVLKFIFRYSERLGRHGQTEPDGCLLIPRGESNHYIGGYDAKLTQKVGGYDIDADEKTKAAKYISILNQNSLIRNLKSHKPVDGHIFISNNLNEGQFSHVADEVERWIEANADATHHSPVIFFETDALISLLDVFNRNFDHIYGDPDIHAAFRSQIVEVLSTKDGYTVFDEESVEQVHDRVLEERSKGKKNRDAFS